MKLLARIFALEYLFTDAMSKVYAATHLTAGQIDSLHADAKAMLSNVTLPGLDPAQSDMWSNELETAISGLLVERL